MGGRATLVIQGSRIEEGQNLLSQAWERVRMRATVVANSSYCWEMGLAWIPAFAGMTVERQGRSSMRSS
jgi:hypothetical protein